MSSTRLPGKVLMDLAGRPVLAHMCKRASRVVGIDRVVVATSDQEDDNPVSGWCEKNNVECYRGSLHDVMGRFLDVADRYKAKTIMRLTADCPLTDPVVNSQVLALFQASNVDYCSNINPQTWPDGLDCEVFSVEALRKASSLSDYQLDHEHVTTFIRRNRDVFSIRNYTSPDASMGQWRWTLDTHDDYDFLSAVMSKLSGDASYLDILQLLRSDKELCRLNEERQKVQSFLLSDHEKTFQRSEKLLEDAERVIPTGTQTFSKSKLNFNPGHAPLFASHGQGGRIWDVDGNGYVDMVMGLLPVSLGYADPDVDDAIRNQLNDGICFSLATSLEEELASKVIDIIPCAEQVRFGKNGSDATSAAIRLARAYTGRDRVIVCGYHGSQDWYIGSTARSKGVPDAVRKLTHQIAYNDLNAVEDILKQYDGQVAGLIMEPANAVEPHENYLSDLKDLLHKYGALIIFDEVITGFRFSLGGAQEYFGVMPDLACFGKGVANGMPLSFVTGREDVMQEMNEIFFSGTFGGEALSLAAALAVVEKMQCEPVIERLWSTGKEIRKRVEHIVGSLGLSDVLEFKGFSPWHILQFNRRGNFSANVIKTYVLHELYKEGILSLGTHNICYAHSDEDIAYMEVAYQRVLDRLYSILKANDLEGIRLYPEIQPVFQVRKTA